MAGSAQLIFSRIVAWTGAALRTHSVGLVVGLLGTLLLFSDLWGHDWSETLWGGQYDPRFLYWTFQWGFHVLFEQWDWLGFYDANIYFPNKNTLAYADPMLGAMALYAPLRFVGLSALTAIYLTLMVLCLVGCVLTDAALLRLGAMRRRERALVVFAAHFSLPVTAFFGTHYQLFGMQLAPAFFLYTFLYLWRWQRRDLAAAGALYLVGSTCAVYLGVMGALLVLPLAAPLVIRGLRSGPVRPWLAARGRDALYVLLPLAAAVYLLLAAPYLRMHDEDRRPHEEYEVYSARLHSIVTDASDYSRWYAPEKYLEGDREFACFPGWLLLVTALLGLAWLTVSSGRPDTREQNKEEGDPPPATGPPRALWRFGAWLFLLSLVLSWGPYVELDRQQVPMLFGALVDWVPGLHGVRAPGRFCIFFGLGLGLLAAAALRRLSSWDRRGLLTWVALALLVLESLSSFPTYPFSIPHADFYARAAQKIKPEEPVLVLPAAHPDADRTFRTLLAQLTGSTLHWGRLMVGYGSGQSEEYGQLVATDREVQAGRMSFEALYNFASRLSIRKVIVFPDEYPPPLRGKVKRYLENHQQAQVLLRTADGIMVEFRRPGVGGSR